MQQAIDQFEAALANERQLIRNTAEKFGVELHQLQTSNRKDSGSFEAPQTASYQLKVPLHGPLKSVGVQLEEHATTFNYQSVFKHHSGEVSGLSGKILGFALSLRQKESILTENYLRFQDQLFDEREMQTNYLLDFYPKQVQHHIVKRRHHNTEKVFRGIEAPSGRQKCIKALEKMRQLTQFQNQITDVI